MDQSDGEHEGTHATIKIHQPDLAEALKNDVIIESTMYDMNKQICSAAFESEIYSKCGDADGMTS